MVTSREMAAVKGEVLKSVHFEVFGKVQGVYFRKFTRDMAVKHGLVGWVQNTDKSRGAAVGVVQGAESQVELMKKWLRETGSPKSRIDRCEFSREGPITRTQYDSFTIKR